MTNPRFGYFGWLLGKINVPHTNANPNRTYVLLMEQLRNIEYTWFIFNDENRAYDGLSLRDEYIEDIGSWTRDESYDDPCSVLEMLVALSRRADYEASGLGFADGAEDWFGLFLKNLGLLEFTDDVYIGDCTIEERVETIVENFLDRLYARNGEGGLFPLQRPVKDQRKVELWYQLAAFILENTNIGD